jgi:bile acid:Na+ symporter, BASS family
MQRFRIVERHLLPLVLLVAALGLLVPATGRVLQPAVSPLLAVLMLSISLTLDVRAVTGALRRPGHQALAALLVYVPMALVAFALARLLFERGPLANGLVLVGVLPTDVSAPLLVLVAGGNVAMAAVMNVVNTALAPVLVPLLFLLLTGVELEVPLARLVGELALTVLLPMLAGVWLRTRFEARLERYDPVYSAASSVAYLALLLAVVGPNAETLLVYGWGLARIAGAVLALNLAGYAIAAVATLRTADRGVRTAYLFTVSKKEFSIAAVVVFASGLPEEVAVPAAVYAVVQMLTSPTAARLLARGASRVGAT